MKIIGCDFHPSFQHIAMVETETGEHEEKRLTPAEAVQFYSQLEGQVVVGMEASGNTLWFERLLASLGHQIRLGDASKIRAMEVRKQKTDRRDAELLLKLLLEGRFPEVWVPSLEMRDVRQLLVHRQKLVGMRRQVKNQLQHLAMNQGVQQKRKLWSRAGRQLLEELPLTGWTARRRDDALRWLDALDQDIAELDRAVEQEAEQHAVARLLQTHPGIGPVTSLAFVLTLGNIERFQHSRQVVSYLGLNPSENSSGGRQRFGAISKQGNPMLRSLLVEAGQSASRGDKELKRAYQRLKQRRHSAVAKVMVARKLAVRLYWMWRTQQPYTATRMQGSPSHPVAAVTHVGFQQSTVISFAPVGYQQDFGMNTKKEVQQGTVALMVLKTLDLMGSLHGYGIARRIEQISGDFLAVNQGTLYPVLLKLEQEGAITSEWGASEKNRRARFYRLTRAGRKRLESETHNWQQTADIIARFFAAKAEDLQ